MTGAKKPDKFTELLAKLARVPKSELDAQEREYAKKRAERRAATSPVLKKKVAE